MTDRLTCTCLDWAVGVDKINAPILLAQARNPRLMDTPAFTFVPWKFCPWCGVALRLVEEP